MLIITAVTFLNVNPSPVYASTKKMAAKTQVRVSTKTTIKWDASALKIVNKLSSFDYSPAIRNAYMKKVENYAKRHKIKVITAKVVRGMRE